MAPPPYSEFSSHFGSLQECEVVVD
ncbi:unnamed protein product [Ectocarpus sp. CCAP 1310/34]|nr:unnamed protein product [Ectocarpus sp. CCAP 1310/34]